MVDAAYPPQRSSALQGGEASSAIQIEVLLATGARSTFNFNDATTSIRQVKQAIVSQWPSDFGVPVDKADRLRLLYLGSFIEDRATLQSAKLTGPKHIVHLVIRPSAVELQRDADLDKKAVSPKCCIVS